MSRAESKGYRAVSKENHRRFIDEEVPGMRPQPRVEVLLADVFVLPDIFKKALDKFFTLLYESIGSGDERLDKGVIDLKCPTENAIEIVNQVNDCIVKGRIVLDEFVVFEAPPGVGGHSAARTKKMRACYDLWRKNNKVLVATAELKSENAALKSKNVELQSKVDELQSKVDEREPQVEALNSLQLENAAIKFENVAVKSEVEELKAQVKAFETYKARVIQAANEGIAENNENSGNVFEI